MQAIPIGGVLPRIRYVVGKTQNDVCAHAGISINFLSQLENGRKDLSHAVAGRLADALGVPVSFLYVLADASGHPTVQKLAEMVHQELERILTARVGERPGTFPPDGWKDWTYEEEEAYWPRHRAWHSFDFWFPVL